MQLIFMRCIRILELAFGELLLWEQYWCTMDFSKLNALQTGELILLLDFSSVQHLSYLMPNYGTNERVAWEGYFVVCVLVVL